MLRISQNLNTVAIVVILLVATLVRAWNITEIPFTHDEFSALFRLKFDSFRELIEHGVKIDGHPAGIQVFLYYWTQLFGAKEWIVKTPFILAGIFSVLFVYKSFKLWSNISVALFSASFVSVSQLAVLYSQIARPYSLGLFFTTLLFYFWSKLVLKPQKSKLFTWIGFVFSASACTYTHHFSLLFAFILGVVGIFIISKHLRWRYIFAGLIVLVLYFPHFTILFYQMEVGGVEEWLSKPNYDFLWRYFTYIFNYSWWLMGLTFGLIIWSFFSTATNKPSQKLYLVFGLLFFLPFLIGFFYSTFVSAVLQFSVLIFSFSFLFVLLLGRLKEQKPTVNLIVVSIILLLGSTSLFLERKHYQLLYNSHYEMAFTDYEIFKEKTNTDLPALINVRKDIFSYYSPKTASENFRWWTDFEETIELMNYFSKQAESKSCFYLALSSSTPAFIVPLAKTYFPTTVEQRNYFTGTHYLLSRDRTKKKNQSNKITEWSIDKPTPNGWSSINEKALTDSGYLVQPEMEWLPTFQGQIDQIVGHKNDFIDVYLNYQSEKTVKPIIVISVQSKSGEQLHWSGTSVHHFRIDSKQKNSAVASLKLSDIRFSSSSEIKVFLWNHKQDTFLIEKMEIYCRKGNPYIYGLVHDF